MAKKIDKYIIDRILEVAKIEEVVGDFLTLRKTGVRYTAICPFHEDRHVGNFVIYPKGNCYKCFACGAKGGVVDFLMNFEKLSYPDAIRWLGKKYHIETDNLPFDYTPPPPPPPLPPLEMLILPTPIMNPTINRRELSTLVQWIRTGIRWDAAQRKRIDDVLRDYNVGCSKQGLTIFWQVDDLQRVRTGKMMLYKTDGHRDKSGGYTFDWIHAALARPVIVRDPSGYPLYDDDGKIIKEVKNKNLYDEDKQEMVSCYFGLHLIDKYKRIGVEQTVCIVESEKTALLMAIAYGNHAKQVWMACGGLENLNSKKLSVLMAQRRNIILYPDRDGIEKWKRKAEMLHYSRLIVDDKPVTKWWKPEDGEKADIADVVIRCIQTKKIYKTVDEVIEDIPALKKMKEKLQLEISNDGKSENQG